MLVKSLSQSYLLLFYLELLMKALAAGSQGANVVSQILLILLRALISEEEREVRSYFLLRFEIILLLSYSCDRKY